MPLPSVADFTRAVAEATTCENCGKRTDRRVIRGRVEAFDPRIHCDGTCRDVGK